MDVAAALVEYGPGERSVGRACCLALCQAGAAQPLLKMITGEPQRPASIKVRPHSLSSPRQVSDMPISAELLHEHGLGAPFMAVLLFFMWKPSILRMTRKAKMAKRQYAQLCL